ncbi:MAG: acyl CoA:acetate/3-ketoacid CoA transferase [Chloroflexi bacterium]|nr:acyl CoA:acetate/3-ketoacid CoA transferase [Chloroflexota bacterium]
MPRVMIASLEEAANAIPDGAVVSISAASGLGCPDAMLRAVGERFAATGQPRQLTTLIPIAAGDMYGIDGIDHLAQPGLLKRVVAGAFPSGPSSMPAPRIRQMIGRNQIEAYNLPSGVLFHLQREAAAGRPGVLTTAGLDTLVDPRHIGGRMNEVTTEDIVRVVEFDGREWLYFPAIPIDVALIRGTTADEMGNITTEQEGAYLGVLDQALAAHNNGGIVIAQVKQLAAAGSLPPQQVRVPGILVDYVVVVPDQMQATQTFYEPALSGEVQVPLSSFETAEWGPEKVLARRAAMELHQDEAVNLGFGISALVPRILLEEGLHGAVTWVIEQGAVGGLPLLNFQFGCSANAQAIIDTPDQFTFFQGGGFDRTMLSFVQVDQEGCVNVSHLAARPHVTSGIGGFIDITSHARRIMFIGFFTAGGLKLALKDGEMRIEREGQARKFVPKVEQVTFSGRRARQRGQQVMYITERCVLNLEPEGLAVTEIAPGIDLERDVLGQTAIPLRVSPTLRVMDRRLFSPEPMGLVLQRR